MNSRLLFPDSDTGKRLETITIFAARRCRTTKSHDELMAEVRDYDSIKRTKFINGVVHTEWAGDVLEMADLIYDLENIPVWLIIELLRHRLLSRDFSIEQLSQRAISPGKLEVDVPLSYRQITLDYIDTLLKQADVLNTPPEELRKMFPQAVLVNLVVKANLRAWSHFFFMRCSKSMGGKGGAHPDFERLADDMLYQGRLVYPILLRQLLPA
jgi:thymidylate synthase ThyX